MREYDRGYLAGYAAGVANLHGKSATEPINLGKPPTKAKKTKRKASAYSMKYAKAFKQVQGKYKLKSGKWAKDGFKRAQKAAHAKAKRMK